jgi:hypothetical protein
MPVKPKDANDYHETAKQNGFVWIGDEVPRTTNINTIWRCLRRGHVHRASYQRVRFYGCYHCRKKDEIDYHELAAKRGFLWIDDAVPPKASMKSKWQCPDGHVWMGRYTDINQGVGCPGCRYKSMRYGKDKYRLLVQDVDFVWAENASPKNTTCKTLWQCSKGHIISRSYHEMEQSLSKGRYCPECSKISEDDYHLLAEQREIKWIGNSLPNTITDKTMWQCQKGHQWSAIYNNIKTGYGCPYCANRIPKAKEDYHKLADNRGIKWLGPEVENTNTKTWWQCSEGHKWEAVFGNIRGGTGCPVCCKKGPSRGEIKVSEVLDNLRISYEQEKRFDDCKYKRHLPFDFYFVHNGIEFLVEYQGEQHYFGKNYYGGEKSLFFRKKRDKIKADYAKRNGFYFMVIPYTVRDIDLYIRCHIDRAKRIFGCI